MTRSLTGSSIHIIYPSLILRPPPKKGFCFNQEEVKNKQVIGNLEAAEKFLERHHTLNEELMKELGVKIIWYESYNDIPEILERITQY